MRSLSTKPLQISISDFRDTDKSTATIAGLVMEARSYQKASNPEGNEVYGAAFPIVHTPVYIADMEDGCYIASGLTDSVGYFNLHTSPNGLYRIKVNHDGCTVYDQKNLIRIDDNESPFGTSSGKGNVEK